MLKQKPQIKSPLAEKGKPKLEEVKVSGVDDILRQMESAKTETVEELNGKPIMRPDRCRSGCSCGPCREGMCGMCEVDAAKQREAARVFRSYMSDDPFRRRGTF